MTKTSVALRDAIRSLSPSERIAFEMQAAGRNCQEIADALEVSKLGAMRIAGIAAQKIKARLKGAARAAGRRRSGRAPARKAGHRRKGKNDASGNW